MRRKLENKSLSGQRTVCDDQRSLLCTQLIIDGRRWTPDCADIRTGRTLYVRL